MLYVCSECDRKFDIYSTFFSHKKRKHGLPTKPCEFCDKLYFTNKELHAHMWGCQKKTEQTVQKVNHDLNHDLKLIQAETKLGSGRNSLIPLLFQ